jgi:hypothetical protein
MSGLGLWNPNKELDKAERSNMSGLGVGHVRVSSLEPGIRKRGGHVWDGGRSCPARASRIQPRSRICLA